MELTRKYKKKYLKEIAFKMKSKAVLLLPILWVDPRNSQFLFSLKVEGNKTQNTKWAEFKNLARKRLIRRLWGLLRLRMDC